MNHIYTALRRTALVLSLVVAALPSMAAGTLDKAKQSGKLTFGYRVDTSPFAFSDGGKATGFSIELCRRVADAVKGELKLQSLTIDFVPVTAASRFDALQQGQIDLSCGTDTPTLQRRATVDFSIPIFVAGIGVMVRADAPQRLRDELLGRSGPAQPVWRGAPGDFAEKVFFAAVGGTTIEKGLIDQLTARRIEVTLLPVPSYAAGVQALLERRAAALFGDRPVLLEAAQRSAATGQLLVLERSFTREPIALALRRGDDAFRLLVDKSLSQLYGSKDFVPLYATWFGEPDAGTLQFYQSIALPD